MSEKTNVWIDATEHNVKLVPIKIPNTDKMALSVYGDISRSQKFKMINELGFRDLSSQIGIENNNIEFLVCLWEKKNGVKHVNGELLKKLNEVFPKATPKLMTQAEQMAHWKGMLTSQYNEGLYQVAENPKTLQLLNSKSFIGTNLNGLPIYKNDDGARFIERKNGDVILHKNPNKESLEFLYQSLKYPSFQRSLGHVLADEYITNNGLTSKDIERLIDASFEAPNQGTKAYGTSFKNIISSIKLELMSQTRDEKCDEAISYNDFENDNEVLFRLPSVPSRKVNGMSDFNQQDNLHLSLMTRGFLGFAEQYIPVDNVELIGQDSASLATYIPSKVETVLVTTDPNDRAGLFAEKKIHITQRNIERSFNSDSKIIITANNNANRDLLDTVSGISTNRHDHRNALLTLAASQENTYTMIVVNSDDQDAPGIVEDSSVDFHDYIYRNYQLLNMIEVSGNVVGSKQENQDKRIYFTSGRRLEALQGSAPRTFNVIETLQDLYNFSTNMNDHLIHSQTEQITTNEAITSGNISQLLAKFSSNQLESNKLEINNLQRRYTPMTNLVQSSNAVIPLNFVDSQKEAYKKLIKDVNNPDQFLVSELGLSIEHITDVLDAGQIDAVTLGIYNAKRNQNMVLADAAGLGKGRILAMLMYWASKQNETPVFMTKSNDLLSDIVRDFKAIRVYDHMNPFIISGEGITNKIDDVELFTKKDIITTLTDHQLVHPNAKPIVLKPLTKTQIDAGVKQPSPPPQIDYLPLDHFNQKYNLILASYSQLGSDLVTEHSAYRGSNKKRNGKNQADTVRIAPREVLGNRARLLLDLVHGSQNPYLFLDESHEVASRSNQSVVVQSLIKAAHGRGMVLRSSATWAKTPENAASCADIFNGRYTQFEIKRMLTSGGTQVQEAFASVLCANAALIMRDHDMGSRKAKTVVDTDNLNRNRKITDSFSKILNLAKELNLFQQASYYKGKNSTNTEQSAHSVSFTSPLHLLQDDLNIAMICDFTASQALESLELGKKPVIAVEKTSQTAMKYLFEQLIHDWRDEDLENRSEQDLSKSEIPHKFYLDEAPSFSVIFKRWLEREQTVKVYEDMTQEEIETWRDINNKSSGDFPDNLMVERKYSWRDSLSPSDPEYIELEAINQKILNEIDKIPYLPLSPIDFITMKLNEFGYKGSEISGRSIKVGNEDGVYFIEQGNVDDKTSAQTRFQSDEANFCFFTKSGTTGISLHSDKDLGPIYGEDALKPRIMYTMTPFQDIADEEQAANRTERKNQEVPSEIVRLSTGLPAAKRKYAMIENNRKSLSSLKSGNSKSLKEMESVNFMNNFGDLQMQYFLMENPDYIDKLSISGGKLEALEKNELISIKTNTHESYVNSILGSLYYLTCAEQEDFLDAFGHYYNAAYSLELAQGRDPINSSTINANITELKSRHIAGGVAQEHYENELDKPLIAKFVDLNYAPTQINLTELINTIKESLSTSSNNPWLSSNGRLTKLAKHLSEPSEKNKMLQQRYDYYEDLTDSMKSTSLFEAIDPESEHKHPGVIAESNWIDKCTQALPRIEIGGTYHMDNQNNDFFVVLDINANTDVRGNKSIADTWKITIANTKTNKVDKLFFRDFLNRTKGAESLLDNYDGKFTEDHEAYQQFLSNSTLGRKEKRWIFDGNLIEAGRMNTLEKIGTMMTIINDKGQAKQCLVATPQFRLDRLLRKSLPCSIQTINTVADVIKNNRASHEVFSFYHNQYDIKTKPNYQIDIVTKTSSPTFSIHLPDAKTPRQGFNHNLLINHNINVISHSDKIIKVSRDNIEKVIEELKERGFSLQMAPEDSLRLEEKVAEVKGTDLALSSLLAGGNGNLLAPTELNHNSEVIDELANKTSLPTAVDLQAIFSNTNDEVVEPDNESSLESSNNHEENMSAFDIEEFSPSAPKPTAVDDAIERSNSYEEDSSIFDTEEFSPSTPKPTAVDDAIERSNSYEEDLSIFDTEEFSPSTPKPTAVDEATENSNSHEEDMSVFDTDDFDPSKMQTDKDPLSSVLDELSETSAQEDEEAFNLGM